MLTHFRMMDQQPQPSTIVPERYRAHMKYALPLLALLTAAAPANQNVPRPGYVRVQINTSEGPIVVALDARRAPATTKNFLAYVDDGRFDGTVFYRTARDKRDAKKGFVQGGIRTDARRILPPFPLETTTKTGSSISTARSRWRGARRRNRRVATSSSPSARARLDARPGYDGYAAFGHVVAGMDTVKKILAKPSGGGMDAMKGQMILQPVKIFNVKRLDGKPIRPASPRCGCTISGGDAPSTIEKGRRHLVPPPFPVEPLDGPRADYSAAAVPLAGRGSRRSAIRADLPVRPRR